MLLYHHNYNANPVVVPKPGDKCRVCIDFTSLNRDIPKKPHPSPHTDMLANATVGYSLLSFLDAYKVYHQIQMTVEDEEKTSFITPEGLFFYKRISFGLKNASIDFQDMINRIFTFQLGRNVEAYIDDILAKTKTSLDIVHDLRETFFKRQSCEQIFFSMYFL